MSGVAGGGDVAPVVDVSNNLVPAVMITRPAEPASLPVTGFPFVAVVFVALNLVAMGIVLVRRYAT